MRKQILVGFLLLCLGIVLGTWLSQLPNNFAVTTAALPTPSVITSFTPLARENATVKRVIDGDTIELTDGRTLRYIGIDTPETVDPGRPTGCFGQEASRFNKQLVEGKKVELEKDVSNTDRYGRLLRYVFVEYNGEMVLLNEHLVKEGYALSSSYPPDIKYQELFGQAQSVAQTENRGLWGVCGVNNSSTSTPQASTLGIVTDSVEQNDDGCKIKGNVSTNGDKIYHMPGCGSYEKTVINETAGERWFCSEQDALNAGWRKAKNCM